MKEITHFQKAVNLLKPARYFPFSGILGTFMGRDALRAAVSLLKLEPHEAVLLPAYLCREVYRPFARHCQVLFYDIGEDLRVDPDAFRHLFKKSRLKRFF